MSDVYFSGGLPTLPAPVIDPETQPYWDGAAEGSLIIPFCLDCEDYFWYPRGFCSRCSGSRLRWDESAGTGQIYSWTVVRRSFGAWKDHAPFSVAWITLDEGISVTANIIEADAQYLAIGARVRAVFERAEADAPAILRFVPAG